MGLIKRPSDPNSPYPTVAAERLFNNRVTKFLFTHSLGQFIVIGSVIFGLSYYFLYTLYNNLYYYIIVNLILTYIMWHGFKMIEYEGL